MGHMHHWVSNYTARVSGDAMDPEKGVSKLLEFLMKDLEKGKVLPEGWDEGLTDELKAHPIIAALIQIQSTQRWDLGRMVHGLSAAVGDRGDDREHVERMIRNIVVSAAQDPFCEEYDVRCLHERIGQTYPDLTMKWATLRQLFRENRGGFMAGEELTDHHAVACAAKAHHQHRQEQQRGHREEDHSKVGERERCRTAQPRLLEHRREGHPRRGAADQRHRSRHHAEEGVRVEQAGDPHADEVLDEAERGGKQQEDAHLDPAGPEEREARPHADGGEEGDAEERLRARVERE